MAAMQAREEGSSPYVKLISKEGHEFYVDRKCAMVSGTIKAMLSGGFMESKGEIRFAEIRGAILEKVIQYVYYKVRFSKGSLQPPEFEIEPEVRGRGGTPGGGSTPHTTRSHRTAPDRAGAVDGGELSRLLIPPASTAVSASCRAESRRQRNC